MIINCPQFSSGHWLMFLNYIVQYNDQYEIEMRSVVKSFMFILRIKLKNLFKRDDRRKCNQNK